MTVSGREVSTPPQIRRIENFEGTLRYPLAHITTLPTISLQKSRNNRRAEHVSSSKMFPPIEEGAVSKSPRRAPPPTPLSRPGTSLARLTEAKENAKKSPYTREEIPKIGSDKLLPEKENIKPALSPKKPPLTEKEEAILKDWLGQATVAEKIVLSNLIESADRLTMTTVTGRKYRPSMAEAITLWLDKANSAEKDIAERFLGDLNLLETLGSTPRRRPVTSGFGPLIDRPAELGYRDVKSDRDIEALFDSLTSELDLSLTKPFSKGMPLQILSSKTPAALWHLDQERDRRRVVENNSSSFVNPNRVRGTHFDIHPEWPCVN
eukprot:sb/3466821/